MEVSLAILRSMNRPEARRASLLTVLIVLGVILAPFIWFPFFGTKAYLGQHLVNALAGVLLGPWWAAASATLIGIIRNILGIGTLYAFPGGIPGAIIVGLTYIVTRRSENPLLRYSAALMEPLGTVFIGGTVSILIVAPILGDAWILGAVEQQGLYGFFPIFWLGWAASSVPGSIMGYLILLALDKSGTLRQITISIPSRARHRYRS